jgi:hypothetical protein|tara:strand:+ start:94 stop:684 length:591 start_codon:yes stop_codon:yes gene_type:complete
LIKNLSFYQNDWIFDIIDQYYNDQDSHKIMGSKKGVAITVGVLVAITIGSFMVWFGNPTSNEMTIVVTDFENHDAGIVERHKIVQNSIESSFDKFMNNEITVDEYEKIAETGSSQNNALLMELAYSDAPEEWQETYVNRIASLKSFGAFIRESMVFSTYLTDEVEELGQKNEILDNMEKYKEEYIQFKQLAESSKP